MTVRYEGDYQGIGTLMRGDEMLAVMVEIASKGLDYARAISPVGRNDPHRGEYRENWHMETSNAGGPNRNRAEAQLVNDAADRVLSDVVDGHDVPAKVLAYLGGLGDL